MKVLPANTKLEKEGLRIAKLLQQSGFKAFWVGGTVRDLIIGREIDNIDMATSAKPEDTEIVLKKHGYVSKDVGKIFGTVLAVTKHGPVEITTFRKEGLYADRRHPQEVIYIDSYLDDSKRRDLTINSIYYDPVSNLLLDPQNGQKDISRKLVKFVGDPKKRIDEDALRMIRAVRFATQLSFKLEKNSFAAIKTRAKYIQKISGARVRDELNKILSHENKEQGVRLLDDLGLLKFIMPEVVALKKIFHKSKNYHLEGSVFEHTMLTLKNIVLGNPYLSYAALYHDAGKATTAVSKIKDEGKVNSFPGHEYVSAELFKNFADRYKIGRRESNMILWITKMHMKRVSFIRDMDEKKKIELAQHKYFPQLLELWRADSISNLKKIGDRIISEEPKAYEEGAKYLNNLNLKKNIIDKVCDGEFIMKQASVKSGPHIARMQIVLKNKILNEEIKNISDAKMFLKNDAKVS